MRFLLKVNIPVEAGNAAAKAGKLGATIQSILADLKPEAVYFTDNNGQRSGFIFLEMQDASEIPAIAEPWFLAFNASIEIHPVMVPDDLARAGGAIEKAVKKYAWSLELYLIRGSSGPAGSDLFGRVFNGRWPLTLRVSYLLRPAFAAGLDRHGFSFSSHAARKFPDHPAS